MKKKEKRVPLFHVYDSQKYLPDEPFDKEFPLYSEGDTIEFVVEAGDISFDLGSIEPYIGSLSLYNFAKKKRISETYYFHCNDKNQLNMLPDTVYIMKIFFIFQKIYFFFFSRVFYLILVLLFFLFDNLLKIFFLFYVLKKFFKVMLILFVNLILDVIQLEQKIKKNIFKVFNKQHQDILIGNHLDGHVLLYIMKKIKFLIQ